MDRKQNEGWKSSALITNRKVENILQTGAGMVATGYPGCNITIGAHLDKNNVKTIHPVQLIQMAMYGGRTE
ncbi:MAG: hypothetical protein JRD69_05450 [Deltaproteobacteria bacterium]|nr:hypothetical protein [Deltaproteobacteria bacterium]